MARAVALCAEFDSPDDGEDAEDPRSGVVREKGGRHYAVTRYAWSRRTHVEYDPLRQPLVLTIDEFQVPDSSIGTLAPQEAHGGIRQSSGLEWTSSASQILPELPMEQRGAQRVRDGTPPMAICLLFHLALLMFSSSAPTHANSDRVGSICVEESREGPDGVLEGWDPTLVDPCTWFYVTCGTNRVTRLDLRNAKPSGSLVPELGKLECLQYLELYMNYLQGPIPKELGGLKSLVSLDLYRNNLTGSIPASLSKLFNLKFLRLNGNRLDGEPRREHWRFQNLCWS